MLLSRISFCAALVMVVLSACNTASEKTPGGPFDLKRLSGRWEYVNSATHQIEEWSPAGEKELRGRGFVLENGDTTFIEFLSIRETNGILTYFAQVSDLSSAEIVPFSLSAQTRDKLEFVNEAQDFPKKIVYELKSDSIMQAYIEGPRDGKNVRITFDFIKQV